MEDKGLGRYLMKFCHRSWLSEVGVQSPTEPGTSPAVPAERDKDSRDWFARSDEHLHAVVGLRGRRLMRAPDGSYTAMVEQDSDGSFAQMHKAEAISMIHHRLGCILSNSRQVLNYDALVDFPLPRPVAATTTERAAASHPDRCRFGLAGSAV